MIKKTILGLAVLTIIAFVVFYFARNMLVETAVEEGSGYALGTKVSLGSASLELSGGSLELSDLGISNPDGFENEYFMVMNRGMLDVDAGSVLDDEVVVDSFVIEGVRLNFEQIDARGNYKILMDNLKQIDAGLSEGGEQKFRIGLVAIRDVGVSGALTVLGNKQYEKEFVVDNITLKDVGGDGGASVGELTSEIVQAIVSEAASSWKGFVPGGLDGRLDQLKQQGQEELESEVKGRLKDAAGSLLGGGEK